VKKNNWFKRNVGMGIALLGALSSPAFAQSGAGTGGGTGGGGGGLGMHGIYEFKLDLGVSKRQTLRIRPSGMVQATQNLGTGNEHAVLAVQGDTIAVAHMSNNVANLRGPSAVKVEIVKMTVNGPTLIAQRQITHSNSDRAGHCAIAAIDATHFLVMYGANNIQGNGNTQTYGFVIDAQANDLTGGNYDPNTNPNPEENHIRLNGDPNQNEAAPRTLLWTGTGTAAKFVTGYYQNGNNGAEYAMLVGIRPGTTVTNGLEPYDITTPQRLTPSNIGRPSIAAVPGMPGIYAFAAPKGQQRPSEQGDEVAVLDANNIVNNKMNVLWRKVVIPAKPDQNNIGGVDGLPGPLGGNGIYPASPTLVPGTAPGEMNIITFISNGAGRNRNKKGSSTSYIAKLNITTTGYTMVAQQSGIGLESSHIVATHGMVGTVGAASDQIILYASGITGMGTGALSFVKHDPTTNTFPMSAPAVAASALPTEGGYLNNMLGRNPATQGREHLNAYADIPNLAYHVTGATFMPKVQSFMVIAHGSRQYLKNDGSPGSAPLVQAADGRMLPEDRNALYLSFISAVRDADEPPPSPPPAPAAGANGGSDGTNGTSGTPGSDGTPGTPGSSGGFSGGCSYGGSAQGGALALILVGGVLLYVTRRRWA
jgi:hypothetical protein